MQPVVITSGYAVLKWISEEYDREGCGLALFGCSEGTVAGYFEHCTEPSGSIKGR